ncbi:MAG: SEC-C domain-containing protein [Acidobacteria bacterium]|nr:SEC-C domain-containing protein [Acidobacteriota bacterium]
MVNKPGRNDVCTCGSKKKFKKCCGLKQRSNRNGIVLAALVVAVLAGGLYAAVVGFNEESSSIAGPGQVWSPEHGHYH